MKLHDPATEREWLRLATQGREGRTVERPDRGRSLWDRASKPFYLLVMGYMAAGILGFLEERARTEHWQTLFCCLFLTAAALIGSGSLLGPINSRLGYGAAFLNLPIPGERVFRWVRSRFLIENAPSVLMLGAVCSVARHGFADASPWSAAATTLLLAGTAFATMILLDEAWLRRLRIARIWTILTGLTVLWVLVLYFTRRSIFFAGNTPHWLAEGILHATWIFPPSWCLPGRFENGGALLALPWIAWGIMRWRSWPQRLGHFFDLPQDLSTTPEELADDEDDEGFTAHPTEEIGALPATADSRPATLLEPMAMAGGGWVDHWVRRVIGKKDAALAAALVDLNALWTKRTNRLILLFPPCLAILWAFSRYFPSSNFKGTAETVMWICAFGFPAVVLLPISNAIPRAAAGWVLGNQTVPVFAMLPAGVRDLLRISQRITLARCLVACVLGTPIYGTLLAAFDGGITPWAACWLVPGACWFWATSRPLFVWYRLQTMTRRRRGTWVTHTILSGVNVALAVAWLISGVAGLICGYALFEGQPTASDWVWLPVWAAGGLVVSGLCARAAFEIHHRQLTTRHLDWLTSG